jgi:hypothetical protein
MLRSILRIDKDNPQATVMLEEIRPSKAGFAPTDSAADGRHLGGNETELSGSDLMEDYPGYPPEPTNRQRRFILLAIALALPIAGLILWKYDSSPRNPSTSARNRSAGNQWCGCSHGDSRNRLPTVFRSSSTTVTGLYGWSQ